MGLPDVWKRFREDKNISAFNTALSLIRNSLYMGIPVLALGAYGLSLAPPWVGAFGAGLLLPILFISYRAFRRRKPVPAGVEPKSRWNPGLKIREWGAICEVCSSGEFVYTYSIIVQAVLDHVDSYNALLDWTGGGELRVTALGTSQAVILSPSSTHFGQAMKITLGKSLRRGEIMFLNYVIFTRPDTAPQPFISITANAGNFPEFIKLGVKFSDCGPPKKVWIQEFEIDRSKDALGKRMLLEPDRDGVVRFASECLLGHRYRLEWEL